MKEFIDSILFKKITNESRLATEIITFALPFGFMAILLVIAEYTR